MKEKYKIMSIIAKIIVGAIRLLLYAVAMAFIITIGFEFLIKCKIIANIITVIITTITIIALLFVIYNLGDETIEKIKNKREK